jgi:hypothetical protein
MEVQNNQLHSREDSIAASTRQRKLFKNNKKIKKNQKNKSKNVVVNNRLHRNIKYSPDYT